MDERAFAGLADRVIEGQRYIATTRTAAGLRASAGELAERVDQLGCRELFPASSEANAVAAVAVVLNEGLRVVTLAEITAEHIEKVVVFELAAVSGMKVRRAAHEVRQAGAGWVGVALLKSLHGSEDSDFMVRFGCVDALSPAG